MPINRLFLFTALSLLCSCDKEPINSIQPVSGSSVIVLCEGTFQWNNASLDLWYPDSSKVLQGQFSKANARPLGDIAQSAIIDGNQLYVVVNNSGSVLKLNAQNLKLSQQNRDLKSPRYAQLWQGRLWVSDLYASKLTVLDTQTLTKVSEAWAQTWSEEMTIWNGQLAVAEYHGQISLYDSKGKRSDSLATAKGCQELEVDPTGNLWVLNSDIDSGSSLMRLSPSGAKTTWSFDKMVISELTLGPDAAYFLKGNAVMRIPFGATSANECQVWVSGPWSNAYSLQFLAKRQEFCLCDARDYVSKGRLFRLSLSGEILNQGDACGVVPGFAIERP
jgi:hypothetical protein